MKGQVAIPETSEELEECLNDDGRLTDILTDGQFADFTQAYIKAAMGNTKAELAAQMREQMQLGTQQVLQDWEAQGMRPKPGAGATLNGRDARRDRAIANSQMRDASQQVDQAEAVQPGRHGRLRRRRGVQHQPRRVHPRRLRRRAQGA